MQCTQAHEILQHEEEKNELGLALIFIKRLGACGDDGVWRIWLQEAWSQASRAEHHSLNQAESANARKAKRSSEKNKQSRKHCNASQPWLHSCKWTRAKRSRRAAERSDEQIAKSSHHDWRERMTIAMSSLSLRALSAEKKRNVRSESRASSQVWSAS